MSVDPILNRLTISRQDFEKSRQFLEQLASQQYGSVPYEALLLSAIVFYARPFSSNEKDKTANAESRIDSAVVDQLTDVERKLHVLILELRNKAVAHAEWTYHPTNAVGNGVIASRPFSIWSYFPRTSDIQGFFDLAGKVLMRANHLTADRVKLAP